MFSTYKHSITTIFICYFLLVFPIPSYFLPYKNLGDSLETAWSKLYLTIKLTLFSKKYFIYIQNFLTFAL